jgi:hypothetical protein
MYLKLNFQNTPILLVAGWLCGSPNAFGENLAQVTLGTNATSLQIQQALDGLPVSGGEVVLLPGVYHVEQPIALRRSNQTLRGSGPATCLRLADHAQCPVIILGEPLNTPGAILTGLRVADLSIDGNRHAQALETWQGPPASSDIRNNGLTIQGVTDSTVERVTAARCRSGGLVTTYYVRRLTVRDFTALDNQFDGLACYATEESIFSNLHLHDNMAAGISFDLSASHNNICDAVLESNDLGIFMRDSRNNLYSHIVVRDCHKFGVFMAQSEEATSTGWQPLAHTACTGNKFVSLRISRCQGAAFRVNDASCGGNQISDAQFQDNSSGGLSQAAPNLVKVQSLSE